MPIAAAATTLGFVDGMHISNLSATAGDPGKQFDLPFSREGRVADVAAPTSHSVVATTPVVREVERGAGALVDRSLGAAVLDNIAALRRGEIGGTFISSDSIVKVVGGGLPPSSPAAHLVVQPSASGESNTRDSFDAMLRSLKQVNAQVIQVSLVSKSVGGFTSSMNKLMSSA